MCVCSESFAPRLFGKCFLLVRVDFYVADSRCMKQKATNNRRYFVVFKRVQTAANAEFCAAEPKAKTSVDVNGFVERKAKFHPGTVWVLPTKPETKSGFNARTQAVTQAIAMGSRQMGHS